MAKDIQQINKGLMTDVNQEFQPEATYRFMLNGLLETITGERGGVANERGNAIIIPTPIGISNPNVIGDCLLPNQDKVLFITGNDSTDPGNPGQEVQIIGLHKENNTFLELIRSECLEFTKCDQVDCIFKVHNGCDIIIYFTDHKNKYKSINITSVETTERYRIDGYTDWTGGNDPNIPTVDPGVGVGTYGWQCEEFFLSPVSEHPNLYVNEIGNNGNLRTGTYTFFVRLLDIDLNPTDWVSWTNPITVKQGEFLLDSPPDNTDGLYVDSTVARFTSKSISLIIDNLDPRFQYYEIGIMERSLDTNLPSFTYRTGQRFFSGTSDIFLFNNVNDSRFQTTTVAALTTNTRKVDVVQAHAQINNRLVLGNSTSTVREWSQFQQKANNIRVEYFTYSKVDIVDSCGLKQQSIASGPQAVEDGYEGVNYSDPRFLSYGMSLMRDEVYALGIIYVFKDGTESPVFHIPGRLKYSNIPDLPNGVTNTDDFDNFDYARYATLGIKSYSTDAAFDALAGGTYAAGLNDFDNQILSVGTEGKGTDHSTNGSWESTRLTNLAQDNQINNVTTDEYKYLYGYKDRITCCNFVSFTNVGSCDNDLQRWQYYNTAIRRKVDWDPGSGTPEADAWNSLDETPALQGSNPTYTFYGGYRGIPGYFDTGISYPDVEDCNGNRIYPEGLVRHHRMPDHRIEQLFDTVGGPGFPVIVDSDLGGHTDNAGWFGASNVLDDNVLNGQDWTMNDSEGVLQLYPLGLNFHNVEPPLEYRDDVVGYYIVRSDRTNNKTVLDKGFMNVCDTSISGRFWASGNTNTHEAIDDFAALEENEVFTNHFFLTPTQKGGTAHSLRNGSGFANIISGEGKKLPTETWWNIMEIHTPLSDLNGPQALAADYIKLESTVFGDLFFDGEDDPVTAAFESNPSKGYNQIFPSNLGGGGATGTDPSGWNMGASVFLNRHKYPRIQSAMGRLQWAFMYNIPLSGLAYAGYNTKDSTASLGEGTTTINNSSYSQSALVAKYKQSCTAVEREGGNPGILNFSTIANGGFPGIQQGSRSVCDLSYPFHYNQLKRDILHQENTEANYGTITQTTFYHFNPMYIEYVFGVPQLTNGHVFRKLRSLDDENGLIFTAGSPRFSHGNAPYRYADYETWAMPSREGSGGSGSNPGIIGGCVTKTNKWSLPFSPYMYYAALKSANTPYEDFDAIRYIKMHSYLIPFDKDVDVTPQTFPITGGDTFINRFQFEKGFYRPENTAGPGGGDGNIRVKFVTSLTAGFVESEYNSMFRHLEQGDLFRTFPYDSRDAYWKFLLSATDLGGNSFDELDDFMSAQEIVGRYKIDYSSTNSEIQSFSLPSTFDFCSLCSESFPNTLVYSEISLDSQVQDFYKLFLTNSEKAIPSYTGSIQDLFVKNSDLYVHTENNLWKLSVAPQTMKTSTDTVEVGQGEFLERDPIMLFNNEDGFVRGGTIDKFASVYGSNGEYIWFDRVGSSVYALGDGPKIISDKGLSRWFSNHSEVILDSQFRELTCKPYPYKGTACNLNVGYKGVLDPEHSRYILTKKDYELLPIVTGSMIQLTTDVTGENFVPDTVIGQYYYDDDGFYVGTAVGSDVAMKDQLVGPIDYTNPTLAENKSWTISYTLGDQSWTSWHSYIPNWTYNDTSTFYSFVENPTNDINLSIWEHNYGPFTTYYGNKFDFIIDYIYKKNPYAEKTFDTIEYTSNVWLEDISTERWIEIPFTTFDRFYVYNNNQLSNLKDITVGNLLPYANLPYTVTDATAHKTRNMWKVNRFRDMAVGRFNLDESLFSSDWLEPTYQSQFDNGFGYIDCVINPAIIDLNKSVYTIERLTDKYLGVRLFFNPVEDYKITFNLLTGGKRNKI